MIYHFPSYLATLNTPKIEKNIYDRSHKPDLIKYLQFVIVNIDNNEKKVCEEILKVTSVIQ